MQGVIVSRVEPIERRRSTPASSAGYVILEINRKPVRSVADYRRIVAAARAGDVLTLYVYDPDARRSARS